MEKRKSMEWEQKTLTSELTQGKELAKQLMNHLHPSASQEKRDILISKILFSYEKAISLLKRDVGSYGEYNHIPNTMLESPTSFGNSSSPMSEISDQDCKNKNVFKERKTMPRWTEEVKVYSGAQG
ncbi:putative WRKY transcription factor 46 [Prunus yedoensis var. nudiflora]|uniref:Putative WRKY transcription factor 46 n=1 Tax=Prunus yedoensis var. nudiflora TaxID=2094558 RepID=A0A314Z187_PRUYE|nr:putative WRKY transcription factor 46 [Prunus yedoensis var. nudiflora]